MWTKLGCEYRTATDDLSAEAFTLHTCALMLSNEQGYDLSIPKRKMWQLGPRATPEAIAELVGEGWWVESRDAYDIGRYRPEWQVPKDVVEHRRKLNAERQDRKRRHDAGDHSRCLEKCPHVTRDELRDPVRNGTDRNGYVSSEGLSDSNDPEPWSDEDAPLVPVARNGHVPDQSWLNTARGYDR